MADNYEPVSALLYKFMLPLMLRQAALRLRHVSCTSYPRRHERLRSPRRCQLDEQVKDLGRGAFGFVQLMRHKATGELVAVKLVERRPEVQWNFPLT